jgi:hypothetical protein
MRARDETPTDRGVMLVMAIVFITVIGLVIASALSYASVSLHSSSRVYTPTRDRLYAADAATKTAVAYVLTHPSEGRSAVDGSCKPVRDFGSVRDEAVTVQVCPQGADSLTARGGGGGWGLITLATGAERGLDVTGAAGLQVNGNVYANSAIAVEKGTLAVTGGVVQALGGCTGSVVVDGAPIADCTVAAAPGVDPGYGAGLTAAPVDGIGSCNTTSKIATIGPGTWTNSRFTTALGSCNYVWLQPGVHYLEDVTWAIKNKVIGGTLPNGTAGMAASTLGAGCTNGVDGTTIVLGGTTNITLSGSTPSLEVCGRSITQPSGTPVSLPLFGPVADIFTVTSGTLSTTTNPTGSTWATVANAKAIDGSMASYNLAKNATTSTMTLAGFSGTAIPSTLRSLKVVVNAVVAQAATVSLLTARNSGESTDACTATSTPSLPIGTVASGSSVTTVTLSCTKALVAPLTFRLAIKAANSGTTRALRVDGISVSFTDNGRVIKAQSGCIVQAGGCAALSTSGNGNVIWLGGEVYLPRASISMQVPNSSAALSTLGVVVRALSVKSTGSTSVNPVVAQDNGALNPGDVTVSASIDGRVWWTCRVTYAVAGASITAADVQGCTAAR